MRIDLLPLVNPGVRDMQYICNRVSKIALLSHVIASVLVNAISRTDVPHTRGTPIPYPRFKDLTRHG